MPPLFPAKPLVLTPEYFIIRSAESIYDALSRVSLDTVLAFAIVTQFVGLAFGLFLIFAPKRYQKDPWLLLVLPIPTFMFIEAELCIRNTTLFLLFLAAFFGYVWWSGKEGTTRKKTRRRWCRTCLNELTREQVLFE
jgi:asparagine N-glycosylation enzyme membrane subunit Stt3